MNRSRLLFFLLTVSLLLGCVLPGISHAEWSLGQNTPNPFCNRGSEAETTEIRIELDQTCEVTLTVLSPDSATVLRTLVAGVMASGLHTVLWDGRDQAGEPLPNEAYPYRLIAQQTGATLFEDIKTAQVSCIVPTDRPSWGRVKKEFSH